MLCYRAKLGVRLHVLRSVTMSTRLSILTLLFLESQRDRNKWNLHVTNQEYFSQMSHQADSHEQACRLLPTFRNKRYINVLRCLLHMEYIRLCHIAILYEQHCLGISKAVIPTLGNTTFRRPLGQLKYSGGKKLSRHFPVQTFRQDQSLGITLCF